VAGITAGYLRDGESEINRAKGATGQVEVRITIRLEGGRVVSSRGSAVFQRFREYQEAPSR
jgi:hypothetical protein